MIGPEDAATMAVVTYAERMRELETQRAFTLPGGDRHVRLSWAITCLGVAMMAEVGCSAPGCEEVASTEREGLGRICLRHAWLVDAMEDHRDPD